MINKLFAVAALSAFAAFAQGPGPGPGGPGRTDRTPPTPEQRIERHVEFLTNYLSLTPSQVTQAKTIFTAEQTAAAALETPMKTAHDNLQNAVKSNLPVPQIEAAATEVGRVHGQMAAVHAKAQAQFRALLTDEQKTKLDSMRRGPGGGGPGGGGPGGPGPRREGFGRM